MGKYAVIVSLKQLQCLRRAVFDATADAQEFLDSAKSIKHKEHVKVAKKKLKDYHKIMTFLNNVKGL